MTKLQENIIFLLNPIVMIHSTISCEYCPQGQLNDGKQYISCEIRHYQVNPTCFPTLDYAYMDMMK